MYVVHGIVPSNLHIYMFATCTCYVHVARGGDEEGVGPLLHVGMYVCSYIHANMYMYIHVCTCVHTCVHTCTGYVHVCVHTTRVCAHMGVWGGVPPQHVKKVKK